MDKIRDIMSTWGCEGCGEPNLKFPDLRSKKTYIHYGICLACQEEAMHTHIDQGQESHLVPPFSGG